MDCNHRRHSPRLNLGIDAELIGLNGRQTVTLQDLSATGAKLQLNQPDVISQGFLRWMSLEAFGDVVWQKEDWCGMAFDRPIDPAWLYETRRAAPGLLRDAERASYRYAEDFVRGRTR